MIYEVNEVDGGDNSATISDSNYTIVVPDSVLIRGAGNFTVSVLVSSEIHILCTDLSYP